jgi:hypothetical protein
MVAIQNHLDHSDLALIDRDYPTHYIKPGEDVLFVEERIKDFNLAST